MVNKGDGKEDIDKRATNSADEQVKNNANRREKRDNIDDVINDIGNMTPEDMLKWIPFMLGRRAMSSKEEIFGDMSDRVDDFSNYVTSSARLFKLETMVYLQVGFNMFINGINSLIATKTLDEPKERLVLGILESAMMHMQNKIDDIKMMREQRIKKESNSKLN